MLENILTVKEANSEVIVLKVKDNLTNLEIAKNPLVQFNYDYFSLIRGKDMMIAAVTKTGEVIHYTSGFVYALLKDELVKFCLDNNLFPYKHCDTIVSGTCFYHQNGHCFRCSLELEDGSKTDIYDDENNFLDLESFAKHIAKKYNLKATYEYNKEYYNPDTYRMEAL